MRTGHGRAGLRLGRCRREVSRGVQAGAAPVSGRPARDFVTMRWPRPLVAVVDLLNRRGKSVGVRLVKYTGKSRHFVHPKHLVESPWHDWYVDYLSPAAVVLDVGGANGGHTFRAARPAKRIVRSEEHTSELQSPCKL